MQNNLPDISIIIPTLNEEEHIGSLLQQLITVAGIEIIISDGQSRDSTAEICRQFPVKIVKSEPGRGQQLNAGAREARGNILFFIHADCRVDYQVFIEIRKAIADHPWGCCTLQFDNPSYFYRIIAAFSNLRSRYLSSCYGDQGIFCNKGLFNEIGQFPATVFLEDIGLSHNLRRFYRAYIVKGRVISSTRRFKKGGIVKTLLKMQLVKLLFMLGMPPEQILEWYR